MGTPISRALAWAAAIACSAASLLMLCFETVFILFLPWARVIESAGLRAETRLKFGFYGTGSLARFSLGEERRLAMRFRAS
jgi:hypothetical protein